MSCCQKFGTGLRVYPIRRCKGRDSHYIPRRILDDHQLRRTGAADRHALQVRNDEERSSLEDWETSLAVWRWRILSDTTEKNHEMTSGYEFMFGVEADSDSGHKKFRQKPAEVTLQTVSCGLRGRHRLVACCTHDCWKELASSFYTVDDFKTSFELLLAGFLRQECFKNHVKLAHTFAHIQFSVFIKIFFSKMIASKVAF